MNNNNLIVDKSDNDNTNDDQINSLKVELQKSIHQERENMSVAYDAKIEKMNQQIYEMRMMMESINNSHSVPSAIQSPLKSISSDKTTTIEATSIKETSCRRTLTYDDSSAQGGTKRKINSNLTEEVSTCLKKQKIREMKNIIDSKFQIEPLQLIGEATASTSKETPKNDVLAEIDVNKKNNNGGIEGSNSSFMNDDNVDDLRDQNSDGIGENDCTFINKNYDENTDYLKQTYMKDDKTEKKR
ncbi:uncharacterized protein LOC107981528 isoform X1 [Nasonia vitripennis]|uniref:Uncharacterized protein n=1 Tax=Nasonia vitripennis TaxID=7425 RepID=A0A7M7T7C9_NASVI|nr:uncharacterized protein LOC107981528 isoform X1 [Nasonia vitripennis]